MPSNFVYQPFDRSRSELRNLWEAFYVARGVSRFRATKLARVKAHQGRSPSSAKGKTDV